MKQPPAQPDRGPHVLCRGVTLQDRRGRTRVIVGINEDETIHMTTCDEYGRPQATTTFLLSEGIDDDI